MTDFISWQDLPKWVPGKTLLASDDLGWKNVGLRSYHYAGQDVIVPAMKDRGGRENSDQLLRWIA